MSSARQATWLTTVLHATQHQIFTVPAVWKKHNNGMTDVKGTFRRYEQWLDNTYYWKNRRKASKAVLLEEYLQNDRSPLHISYTNELHTKKIQGFLLSQRRLFLLECGRNRLENTLNQKAEYLYFEHMKKVIRGA
ncbi:hypothetical protein T12_16961 [Trichinella patagoniensis]|uniref:Uncharacterized protein n=1 Tax=Trichinella patagoniensis TaxID=990121 RepID=A0A0V1A9B6_9BILA|nr:hypothetical protein T12_16961 [Trichinella patagoniensis]